MAEAPDFDMDLQAALPPDAMAIDPSHLGLAHDTLQRAFGADELLSIPDMSFQTLPPDAQPQIGSFEPASAFGIPQGHVIEEALDLPNIPPATMGSFIRSRKKKAPTLRAADWEPYKARILDLLITQKLPLPKVKEMMEEETGFKAELRQYRIRISKWGKDKNIKPDEMRAIVRKRQRRKLVDVNKRELRFVVRGNTVEQEKIIRWMKRNGVPESALYASDSVASTPPAVHCLTISERGSPVPSHCPSPLALTLSPEGARDRLAYSSARSVQDIISNPRVGFPRKSPSITSLSLLGRFDDQFGTVGDDFARARPPCYKTREELLLREKLSNAENLLGTNHSTTLGLLGALSVVLDKQGRYNSAEIVARTYLQISHNSYGRQDPITIRGLDLLGKTLIRQGNFEDATALCLLASQISLKITGELHSLTLICLHSYSLVLGVLGKYAEAKSILLRVVEIRERSPGSKYLDLVASLQSLAEVLHLQQKYIEAESVLKKALAIEETVIGLDDPFRLTLLDSLGMVFAAQGKCNEALSIHRCILQTKLLVLGPDHPSTFVSMCHVGRALSRQLKDEEAEIMLRRGLEGFEMALGPHHIDTIRIVHDLANVLERRKQVSEASGLYLRACDGLTKNLGEHHPETKFCRGKYDDFLKNDRFGNMTNNRQLVD